MPNPTQQDLHIDVPLTNVSIAYMQRAEMFVADRIFPNVPVQKRSDLYWRYNRSDWRRTDAQKRAPGAPSPGSGYRVDTDTYFAHVWAVHKDIDDQTRANADSNFRLDREATEFVTNQLLLRRDKEWVDSFFKTGVWGFDATVGSPDSPAIAWDAAGSTPIEDIQAASLRMTRITGYRPNRLVLGANVYDVLRNHSSILERIKYTQRGVISADLLASFFEVGEVLVPYATEDQAPEYPTGALQDANEDFQFIAGANDALLVYAPNSPSLMEPSAGYTFSWNGYMGGNNQRGVAVTRFRMQEIRSDRVEGEMAFDMKVVAPDCGHFFPAIVSP